MTEREQLEQIIGAIEAQRSVLGDAAVDAAVAVLQQKRAALETIQPPAQAASETAQSPSLPAQAERKTVTIMFADLSGFTALSEQMDPEAVSALVNSCFQTLVPVIDQYGGVVDKFMGDEIMALFGAPYAHENDPERAVRAALDMMRELAAFNAAHHLELGLHIGINTGLVVAGEIGVEQHRDYDVMGDAVNLAARFAQFAEREKIIVGGDTYRLTSPLFDYEALDPIQLKGKAKPVQAYRVSGIKIEPGSLRGLEKQGLSSPLVGRQAEVAAFQQSLARLRTGQGGILSLTGEAGLGKSRLVAEVRKAFQVEDSAEGDAVLWLEGRTLSFAQGISYWPFQEIIRRYAGITEEDGEGVAWNKLQARVTALFPDQPAEVLPYLASLVALPVPAEYEARVKYLDGEGMGRQIFLTSRRLFERMAQERPLVLLFEDLHWVDQASAALVEHLLPLVESAPILLCLIARPDPGIAAARLRGVAAHTYPDRYTEIRLQPLSPAESNRLVHNLLAMDALPAAAQALILRKAEGNPFYVEEVIRTLIAMGAIVRDSATGRWAVMEAIDQVTIPDTLQGIIMARIDRMDEEVKQVLRMASVIGRSFLYSILCELARADRALDQHLTDLQQAELIREKSRVPELEYIFKHALTQEATYQSILMQRRRELHAQVGAGIERLFAGRLEGFYGILAYHYARAEVWDKAQEYLFKAGDQAGQLAADAEALANYQQALEAYARAFGDQWDPQARAVLDRKMGEAFYHRGEYTRASEYMVRALGYLGYQVPTSRWGVRVKIARQLILQGLFRMRLFRSPAPDKGPANANVDEAIHLANILAWIYVNTDQEQVLMLSLWMLNVAERLGSVKGIAQGSSGFGYICDLLGLRRIAGFYHQRAAAMAEASRHPAAIGLAYETLAIHEHLGGDWANAIAHYQRASQTYREMGDLYAWAVSVGSPASLWRLRGQSQEFLPQLREAVSVCRDAGDAQALGIALQCLAHMLVYTGPLDEAVATAQEAIDVYRSVPSDNPAEDTTGELGLGYIRQGRLDEAVAILEKSNHLLEERGVRGMPLTQPRDALAAVYLAKAEQASGAEKQAWLNKARRACRVAVKQGKVDRTGWLRALRLHARCEWLSGNERAARQEWRCGLAQAQRLEAPYEIGMMHLEMGEYTRTPGLLEQAEAILSKTGAHLDWEHARKLLAH
ncbi:MAG: adenylate/guanylate cyclase domain-containing protein [Anaerolineae bacterium]